MRRFWRTLGRRWPLVVLPVALAGAAALYSFTAEKRYEARAELLVSPVGADDTVFLGFGVLRASGDGSRMVATAARLVKTPEVADAVKTQLGLPGSRQEVLDSVSARALGSSNVVGVVGSSSSPARAAQIANAFAQETVAQRTARFQSELASVTRRLSTRLAAIPPVRRVSTEAVLLERRLAELRGLVATSDPTLRVVSSAVAPADPVWPRPWLLIPLGAAVGLGLAALLVLPLEFRAARRRRRPVGVEAVLEDRERALEARERELEAREAAVPEAPAPVSEERAAALAAAERTLAQRAGQLGERESELERREQELAGREREAERELAERAERVWEREREMERREAELALPERVSARAPEPTRVAAVADGGPAPAEDAPGAWNLTTLERLVEEHAEDYPHRVEEWRSYVFFLREHADADGRLPSTFDWLVEDTFAELVG